MKKLLLTLFISLGLIGCSSTAPKLALAENGIESYYYWNCYDYIDDSYVLSIGYIPELKEDGYDVGRLFLKGVDAPIDTIYQLKGVQHSWKWEDYQIVIDSNGTGRFWDFTGAKKGEERNSKEVYKCYF